MKKTIGIIFIILYIALATFITLVECSFTRTDFSELGVFIDQPVNYRTAFNLEFNYPKASTSAIFSYILKNIVIFGIGNFISSLIFWGILHVKPLKDLATKKVLAIMTTIPIIILLIQLIIMIPRYVVYR